MTETDGTFISIIIPVRNEERFIEKCLDSVLEQTYPANRMQVLIIDGRSTDQTRTIVSSYKKTMPTIELLDNPEQIIPCALNIGIKHARGEIIIRMDAHTYYEKDYIEKCVATLKTVNAENVGGPIVTLPGDDTATAKAIALATSHPFGVGNSKFRTSKKAQFVDTVTFGAFHRHVFTKIGLFNEMLHRNQDIELNSRIIAAGGKIFLNPDIKSYYYNQTTLTGLWKQNFGNGKWNVLTLAMNKKSLSLRHFIPLLFVTGLLGSLFLSLFNEYFLILFFSILLSHTTINALVSRRLGANKDTYVKLILPLTFFILHFSYGLGYFWGGVKLSAFLKKAKTYRLHYL